MNNTQAPPSHETLFEAVPGPQRFDGMVKDKTYEQYRSDLIAEFYNNQLETLISGYHPNRKTVILLPGGMGSQLQRTEQPYPALPNVPDDVIWIALGILLGDGLKLEIDNAGKDLGAYVIAPHGPLKFFTEKPYDELEYRAEANDWNYGVFGFDWRRPLKESSASFQSFILEFQKRVRTKFHTDPIPKLTVVCHSMGGLVATHALRDKVFSGLGFNAIMTIATPFYGTSNHQDRYFIGDQTLKKLHYSAKDLVRIIASLPGPYTLMLLSKDVFDRDKERIGLERYPQHGPSGNDPCDPFAAAMMSRWPKVVRDHWQYIDESRKEMIDIASQFHATIAPRFFNVRSALDTDTAVELIWADIDGTTIDPETGPSPLTGLKGPGDGTVPAWSAFHAYCKSENRHDLTQTKGTEHANLLNHDEVLTLIGNVVATGRLSAVRRKLPKARRKGGAKAPTITRAHRIETAMSRWIAESRSKLVPSPPPPEVQHAFVASLIGGTKPRMSGRSKFTIGGQAKRARKGKGKRSGAD